MSAHSPACTVEPGYAIERIVAGSGFHTANGVAFGPDGRPYVASVSGESIFALDIATGAVTVEVGPFAGEADDLLFTPGGDLIWTAFMEGAVRRPAGTAPPRLVADHTGGLNAVHFGPDGMIHAPSWDRGQVVRVDPESGATTVLADGFGKPGAVRFDAADQLYVLDDKSGELWALDRDCWWPSRSPDGS